MWYILLKNEQLGPMTENEVIELYKQGVLDLETLVWREGLTEWASLIATPEFSNLGNEGEAAEESLAEDESEDATLIANPADADLQAALAELLGETPGKASKPSDIITVANSGPALRPPSAPDDAADSSEGSVQTGHSDSPLPNAPLSLDPLVGPEEAHQENDAVVETKAQASTQVADSSDSDDSVDIEGPPAEAVDEHSILQVATHTLDDIVDENDAVVLPDNQASTPDDRLGEDADQVSDERPTIGFPMPEQFMIMGAENSKTSVEFDSTESAPEDGSIGRPEDPRDSDDGSVDHSEQDEPSILTLGSLDIDSFEEDPSYKTQRTKLEKGQKEKGEQATPEPPLGVTRLIADGGGPVEPPDIEPPETKGDAEGGQPLRAPIVQGEKESSGSPPQIAATSPDMIQPMVETAEPAETLPGASLSAVKTEVQASEATGSARVDVHSGKPRRRWPLVVVVAALLLGGVTAVAMMGQRDKTADEPTKQPKRILIKTVNKVVKPLPDAAATLSADSALLEEEKSTDAGGGNDAAAPSVAPKPAQGKTITRNVAKPRKQNPRASSKAQKTVKKMAQSSKVKSSTKQAKKPRETVPSTAEAPPGAKVKEPRAKSVAKNTSGIFRRTTKDKRPVTLGRRQITRVLKKNSARLKKCITLDAKQKGRLVSVAIQIKRDGRVGRAKVATSIARGTPGGACIESQVLTYRFPPFKGEQMSITLPLRLQ